MSNRALVALACSLFALTVLARAPARWLLAAAPSTLDCEMPSGSVWHGECVRLRAPGLALTAVGWKLHPMSLLLGRLDLELRSSDARAPATARVVLGLGGHLSVRDLRADLPVDSGFLPLFPSGWSGQLQLAMDRVEFDSSRLAAVHGTIDARSIAQQRPAMPFGSFELRFGDASRSGGAGSADSAGGRGDAIVGELRDLGGPLAVTGTLTIRNGHDYELSGFAAARPEATAELAKAVEFLGQADAQGRRPYSLAGSFGQDAGVTPAARR
jgi:general secretion pathway protein N